MMYSLPKNLTRNALLLGITALAVLPLTTLSADAAQSETATREVAAVDLELTPTPGVTLALSGQQFEWNRPNQINFTINGDEHQVDLKVARSPESESITAKLGYWHNGKVMIEEQSLALPAATTRTIASEQAKVAFSVAPKQIPTRKKLRVGTTDDPLSGL